jgi:hypothetical protein
VRVSLGKERLVPLEGEVKEREEAEGRSKTWSP